MPTDFARDTGNFPRSTASIAGHPIHPMLVPFPIAFFVATLACDTMFLRTANPEWIGATMWLLGAGLAMAGLAALAGVTDLLGDRRIARLGDTWLHAVGNVLIVSIEALNLYIRYQTPTANLMPIGALLSLLAVMGLLFTGWKGGKLVYRHRIGMRRDDGPI